MDSSSRALITAVIDLGTNTFNLVIGKVNGKSLEILFETKVPVLIGESVFTKGVISKISWQRGLETITYFDQICKEHHCNNVIGVGTATFRKASNGHEFLDEIKLQFDISIQVISGKQEAEYIFWGAQLCTSFDVPTILMDIGGGSTEILAIESGEIISAQSIDIGVSHLHQNLPHSEPPKPKELEFLTYEIALKMEPILCRLTDINFKPKMLVGTAGSFDSIADIIRLEKGLQLNTLGFEFDIAAFNAVYKKLTALHLDKRKNVGGLHFYRAQYIIYGMAMIKFITSIFNISKINQVKYALKEGLIYKNSQ